MAAPFPQTVEYLLSGGPCDGKTLKLNSSFKTTGIVYCGGAQYEVNRFTSNPVFCVYIQGSEASASASDPTLAALAAHAPKTLSGWGDLRQSINKRLPTALNKAAKMNRQTLAAIGRVSRGR